MTTVFLNGKFVDQVDASLDPLDRGVMLGDGIFETIRCEEHQLLSHVAHFNRLARSSRIVEIPWNMSNEDLLAVCHQVLDANNLETARLRITLTRGEMGPSPEIRDVNTAPTLIVNASPFDATRFDHFRQSGWGTRIISFPINHRSPLSEVKSTSYQEKLLGRLVVRRDGFDEGIFLNTDGIVAEGAMSNIFIVRHGEIYTPPIADGALPGIMRMKTRLICDRVGVPFHEESITLEDLHNADEVFFTNVLIEIIPVVRIDDKAIPSLNPEPIWRRIHVEHRRDIESYLKTLRGN